MHFFGDLPGWLELVIGVAALAGGGAGGGYLGARQRARLADRRTIDDLLIKLRAAIKWTAQHYDLFHDRIDERQAILSGFDDGFERSCAAVARLPWSDRAEWVQRSASIEAAVAAPMLSDNPADLDEFAQMFQKSVDAIDDFRRFSREHVNPAIGSRSRRFVHKAKLVLFGPRPWAPSVRQVRDLPRIDLNRPIADGDDIRSHYM